MTFEDWWKKRGSSLIQERANKTTEAPSNAPDDQIVKETAREAWKAAQMTPRWLIVRELFHFCVGLAIAVGVIFALSSWAPHWPKSAMITVAWMVGACPSMRELRDSLRGQATYKTVLDVLAWVAGAGVGAFGFYWSQMHAPPLPGLQ